jgi:hypothetical protein
LQYPKLLLQSFFSFLFLFLFIYTSVSSEGDLDACRS